MLGGQLCTYTSKYVIQKEFSEKIEVPFRHSLYKVEGPEHQSLVLADGRNVKATWLVYTTEHIILFDALVLQRFIIPTDKYFQALRAPFATASLLLHKWQSERVPPTSLWQRPECQR